MPANVAKKGGEGKATFWENKSCQRCWPGHDDGAVKTSGKKGKGGNLERKKNIPSVVFCCGMTEDTYRTKG